ncbi:phosphopantetheine-binding protein [Afifella sp. H1R]|uniref:phosphopantetheine-binding protein n=1 Tax=Afifella sp. H1R TaxID=2908841 RepID=UPI001F1C6179|nr:phosphopantetheine-binding protein [Afifella sp. H1R]MCF1502445.1 phosphopantetheine-binding protein [Afifella sp. H1R]
MSGCLTRETMRADIAAAIHTQPNEVGDDDDLMDLGLDSMRAMHLVLLWQERGLVLDFSELAEEVTLSGWWAIAERHLHPRREAAA